MGHNEDGDPIFKDYSYLVNATFYDENGNFESQHVAYYYTANLAGQSWGWNSHGIVFTDNTLFPNCVNMGVGDTFFTRAAYDCSNISCVLNIINAHPRAHGLSFNVGSLAENTIINIEVNPSTLNVYTIAGNYSHENEYKHTPGINQSSDPSSTHRQMRINEYPPVASIANIQTILGDHTDPIYPIYRNGSYPDCTMTLTTSIFDLNAKNVSIYFANPATSQPVFTFPLP